MRWTRAALLTRAFCLRTEKSCGPDASTLVSSLREAIFASDGDKKARSPGRARRKPLKPLRAGMPGDFRCDRCEYSFASCTTTSHTRLRVHWAPGIPHALTGRKYRDHPGVMRRGIVKVYLAVIAPDPAPAAATARSLRAGRSRGRQRSCRGSPRG